MIDIKIFKTKLLNNEWMIFSVDSLNSYFKLEDTLLNFNYKWRLLEINQKNLIHYNNGLVVHINYQNLEPKILSYDTDYNTEYSDNVIFLTEQNIDYLLKKIFKNEPDYSSRKIIRTL